MRTSLTRLAGVLGLAAASWSPVAAQQPLAEQVLEGCVSELETYCAAVTPGEGRLLACLYAYGDKLSGQCDFALYDAAVRLERAISALTYVASECRADFESPCAGVQAGEGRIAQCLSDHQSELSATCNRALEDVGLKEWSIDGARPGDVKPPEQEGWHELDPDNPARAARAFRGARRRAVSDRRRRRGRARAGADRDLARPGAKPRRGVRAHLAAAADGGGAGRIDPGSDRRGGDGPRGAGDRPRPGRYGDPPPAASEDGVRGADLARPEPADDAALQAYLEANPERFTRPGRLTFTQVFLSRDRRGADLEADAARLLEQLNAGLPAADPADLGDPSLLEPAYADTSTTDVERLFGADFAARLDELPVGRWVGPVVSPYGEHLVRLKARSEPSLPRLEQVRAAVAREVEAERAAQAREALVAGLRERYDVVVQRPEPSMAMAGGDAGARR